MLHPYTWGFPCRLMEQMSRLRASGVSLRTAVVSPGFLMSAQKTERTGADDAYAAHRACPHGWAQSPKPMGCKAVCGFWANAGGSHTEVKSDINQRITSNPYLFAKKESKSGKHACTSFFVASNCHVFILHNLWQPQVWTDSLLTGFPFSLNTLTEFLILWFDK